MDVCNPLKCQFFLSEYLKWSTCCFYGFSWEDKLPLSKSALESTWLYHEIGRCHLELGNFSKAQDHGDKSLEAAREAEDEVWKLNATVLVAQAQGKGRTYLCSLNPMCS